MRTFILLESYFIVITEVHLQSLLMSFDYVLYRDFSTMII